MALSLVKPGQRRWALGLKVDDLVGAGYVAYRDSLARGLETPRLQRSVKAGMRAAFRTAALCGMAPRIASLPATDAPEWLVTMANTFLEKRQRLAAGLDVEYLVRAGHAALLVALEQAENLARRRAYFGMVDELRRWYAVPHWRYRKETGVDSVLRSASVEFFEHEQQVEPDFREEQATVLVEFRRAAAERVIATVCIAAERAALYGVLAGLSTQQIAEKTGRTERQVREATSRGIARLRKHRDGQLLRSLGAELPAAQEVA